MDTRSLCWILLRSRPCVTVTVNSVAQPGACLLPWRYCEPEAGSAWLHLAQDPTMCQQVVSFMVLGGGGWDGRGFQAVQLPSEPTPCSCRNETLRGHPESPVHSPHLAVYVTHVIPLKANVKMESYLM